MNKYIVLFNKLAKVANDLCVLMGIMLLVLILVNAQVGKPLTIMVDETPYTVDFTGQPSITILWIVFILIVVDVIGSVVKFVNKIKKRYT